MARHALPASRPRSGRAWCGLPRHRLSRPGRRRAWCDPRGRLSHQRGGGRAATASAVVHYSRTAMRATLTYTLLRLLLFFAVALILALFGVHGITLIAVALIVSSIVSLLGLSKLRDRMSISLSGRISRFSSKLDAGTRAEDND